jgi:hypothetical protein
MPRRPKAPKSRTPSTPQGHSVKIAPDAYKAVQRIASEHNMKITTAMAAMVKYAAAQPDRRLAEILKS